MRRRNRLPRIRESLRFSDNHAGGFCVGIGEGPMVTKAVVYNHIKGAVHCPICTRTVEAEVDLKGKRAKVAPGQRCPRCNSSLDVAVVVALPEAA